VIRPSNRAVSPKYFGAENENREILRAAQFQQNPEDRIRATQISMPAIQSDSQIWDTDRRIRDEMMQTIIHQNFQ
jgi:hypothetical protein